MNNLVRSLWRNRFVFLIHLGLSFFIPFFISLFFYSKTFYDSIPYGGILLSLTCSIQMTILSILFFYIPSEWIVFTIILNIIIRLALVDFFTFLHRKNKMAGLISNSVFIIINILLGKAALALLVV